MYPLAATQCAILHNLGCEYGQGFWFSRPLPAEHMAAFLQHIASATKEGNITSAI